MNATDDDTKAPPGDLLQRAREAARQELEALRDEPEQPKQPTLLTGFRRFE